MTAKYVFTITAGRTGTAWLTEFLGANLGIEAVHEPLGIDDFGLRMPDIKLMRTFNERGNTDLVQQFYRGKFDEIAAKPGYAETNHTLAKCGLIENLAEHPIAAQSAVIVLRRDFVQQCVSYVARGDFRNITIDWQWYLSRRYPNLIVNPAPFRALGQLAGPVWFVHEMDARQGYYERLYADRLALYPVRLEDLAARDGAADLLARLGHAAKDGAAPILPARRNQSASPPMPDLVATVAAVMAQIDYDREAVVSGYLKAGRRLAGG